MKKKTEKKREREGEIERERETEIPKEEWERRKGQNALSDFNQ